MPRSATRQQEREAKIKAAFSKLSREKKHTKSSRILELVGKQFDLQPETVRKIVSGHYDRRRQQQATTPTPAPV